MAVDYEEGRRLYDVWQAERAKLPMILNEGHDTTARDVAHARFIDWVEDHAEALLNPDPWRPISELEAKHKDGRKLDLWVGDYADGGFRLPDCRWGTEYHGAEPCWMELKPHPDARHDWEWQPIDFVPTHFREIKGPGHE